MKYGTYFFTFLFFVFIGQSKAQEVNPHRLIGVYQSYIDPSTEFIIKKSGEQVILEIPGQGQVNLVPDGGDRFHINEIPLALQFHIDAGQKASGFGLEQRGGGPAAEWIKIPGENLNEVSGHYRLKNDPYKSIYVTEKAGQLTGRVNDGPSLLIVDSAGKLSIQAGDYTIWYQFIKDKEGHFTKLVTRDAGTLRFVRVKDYDVALTGGFLRPYGFTRADTLRGMLTPLRTCYDVKYYSLDVEVFPYKKLIKGRNTIRFKAVESFDRMQVDLYENMKIEKIVYRDEELVYTREYNAVFIQFPKTITKGIEDSINVFYEGKPIIPNMAELKGGFFWRQDRDGNPWIQSVCQGSGASLWWPCKDHLSDEPDSMKISVIIPDNLFNISNGKLLNTVRLPGHRKQFNWSVSYPINNYNVVLNIGNYKYFSDVFVSGQDSLRLNFYCLPYNLEPAKKIFGKTKEMLSFLENSYGRYPFPSDGFTLMESLYPMEHQGAVSIGPINNPVGSDKVDYNGLTRLTWHETAHEWWGNNITAADIADIWIHEAFATYTEVMMMEFFEGGKAAEKLLHSQVPDNKDPLIGSYGVNDFRIGEVYSKGCLMLHTLRNTIDNDSTWFSLLRQLQQHFRYQTVTTESFVNYINKLLVKDFTPFFDQYLRHAAIPELELKFKKVDDKLEVQYRWKVDVENFNMRVKITTSKSGFDFIYPESAWKTITINGVKRKDFKVDTDRFFIKVSVQ